jgi:phosphoribosyl 1,2-cyclic phosphate phosphodiesterase
LPDRTNAQGEAMDLTFLGTAASEGYPVPFCACTNCEQARALGGPNLRKRSAAIVDGTLLLDIGTDVFAASLMHGIPFTGVRYCLLTHEHEDHLDVTHLHSRHPDNEVETPALALYATAGALQRAAAAMERHIPPGGLLDPIVGQTLNLSAHAIAPGESFAVGPYRVTAIPAQHDPRIVPLLYAIERDGRALLYATDTGPLPEAAWAILAEWGDSPHQGRGARGRGKFNVVVLDHTFGLKDRDTGHNNADQFVETVERLRASGRLAEGCRIFAHHLGHHSNPDHDTLSRYAAGRGYEVAYDGLTVRV